MLFYNHKQEFIGIDEEGLKLLNYTTFEDLMNVCKDVADLFAKEPGYIHNFKSFGWIDFLLHADSDARSAIVQGNGRTFSCTLQISTLFLSAEPSSPGYIIEMLHVQSLSGDEIKPHAFTSKPKSESKPFFAEPEPIASSVLPNYDHITPTTLSEPGMFDIPAFNESDIADESVEELYAKFSLADSEEETSAEPHEEAPAVESETFAEPRVDHDVQYSTAEKSFIDNLKVDKSYQFDPNIAAQELGLPVDLIQEFIGDFILQSNEFKEELFEAALKGDMNNLKILSHKLKGVAANLRIEDAFETLSIINTSNDPIEIEANLKYFYKIIAKLEGKDSSVDFVAEQPLTAPIEKEEPSYEVSKDDAALLKEDDEIYSFDFKDNDTHSAAYDEEPVSSEPTQDHPDDIYAFDSLTSTNDENDLSFAGEYDDLTVSTTEEQTKEDQIYSFDIKDDNVPINEDPYYLDDEPIFRENLAENVSEPLEALSEEKTEEPKIALHVDRSLIAGQLGVDIDFFNELILEYKHDALKTSREISAAVSAFDTHAWKKSAVQLKGISDNLRLSEISEELAVLSRTNDAQEAHQASKRLDNLLEQL